MGKKMGSLGDFFLDEQWKMLYFMLKFADDEFDCGLSRILVDCICDFVKGLARWKRLVSLFPDGS